MSHCRYLTPRASADTPAAAPHRQRPGVRGASHGDQSCVCRRKVPGLTFRRKVPRRKVPGLTFGHGLSNHLSLAVRTNCRSVTTKRAHGALRSSPAGELQMGDSERDARSTREPFESHSQGAQAPCSLPQKNKKVARGRLFFLFLGGSGGSRSTLSNPHES